MNLLGKRGMRTKAMFDLRKMNRLEFGTSNSFHSFSSPFFFLRHGQGKFTTKELVYQGEWDSDSYEGQGKLSRYGESYEGTSRN
jgi:hypothetical protein